MRELYTSPEWKNLDEIDRSQLLLVIEGLKRGTIIYGNWTTFMDIIKKNDLDYKLNTSKYRLKPVVVVARSDDLQEINRRYLSLAAGTHGLGFHKISGWLLSYPECCTAEYVKKRTPDQQTAKNNKVHHLSYKFGQELDAMIRTVGNYPEIFDYRPPSFTPCGINCPEAIRILTDWKNAIDDLDPDAGKELVYFNRKELPERSAHKDYLAQEFERRSLEHKLEFLRRSIS